MSDNELFIVQPYVSHAKTSIGKQRGARFEHLAECSGLGRSSVQSESIARRIAACLNACRDISTETIEKGTPQNETLAQECSALRFALREARSDLGHHLQTNCGDSRCLVCADNRAKLARIDELLGPS